VVWSTLFRQEARKAREGREGGVESRKRATAGREEGQKGATDGRAVGPLDSPPFWRQTLEKDR
jgi:hypothetical protein